MGKQDIGGALDLNLASATALSWDRAVSPVVVGRTKSSKKGQPGGGRPTCTCANCEQLQRELDAAQSDLQAMRAEIRASGERRAKLQAQLAKLQRMRSDLKVEVG